MSPNDPAHPLQLLKMAKEVQGQAAADAEYDMPVPQRFKAATGKKEGFRSPFEGPSDFVLALGLLVLVFFIWLAVRRTTRCLYSFLLVLGFAVFFLIHKKAFDP